MTEQHCDDPKRYIGTFHKTGTRLFHSILTKAKNRGILEPWIMQKSEEPPRWDIAFDYHSTELFRHFLTKKEAARYVICVRDPRDVIVSAAYYHCKADEPWLHVPDEKFDGLSYQQKINSFSDMQSRFIFEMENASGWQIRNMLKIPKDDRVFLVTKLETLVHDLELWEYHRIFVFLRFKADGLVGLLKAAYDSSLFSGKVMPSVHVRSGKAAQYESEFSPDTLKQYYRLFGNAAEQLGYVA